MIYPNIECYYLCVWMTDVSAQRLTGSQTALTNIIKAAALASSSVTTQQWNDFNYFAQWRNPFYLVYRDYQQSMSSDLTTDLLHFYNFEGNSNDSVGSLNGTDTGVTYSNLYGKIGQGVRNNNSSSKIEFGAVSDFNFIHQTGVFSVNVWFQATNITLQYSVLGSTSLFSQKGFWFELTNGDLMRAVIPLGTSSSTNVPLVYLSQMLTDTAYNMYTLTSDGVNVTFYKNAQVIGKTRFTAYTTGDANNIMQLFTIPSLGGSSACNIDLLSFWSRGLNAAEVLYLYNGGAGRSYPF